jgi:hypothetical protein
LCTGAQPRRLASDTSLVSSKVDVTKEEPLMPAAAVTDSIVTDPAVTDPAVTDPAVASFVRRSTLKSTLARDPGALDHVMATAYQLYQAGRYAEVDVLCRGLIAADDTYWWSYALRASALRRLGRLEEALVEVDHGLAFEPDAKRLLFMRGEILSAIGQWRERAAGPAPAESQLSP